MKIVLVTAATNTVPRFREDMIGEWMRRGAEVVVLGDEPEDAWEDYFAQRGARYRSYPVSRNGLNPAADLRTKRKLCSILLEEGPEKVFTYQAKPNIYGCLAAHEAGVPEIYVMMGGLGSIFAAEDPKSRAVRAVVSSEYKMALKHARRVFFQNGEDVDLFERLHIVDRSKVVMLRGSGVNIERFAEKPLPDQPSFLFVGRLVKGKGIREFLEAARVIKARQPKVSFDVVGPFDTNPTSISSEELQPYVDDGTVMYHGEQEDVRPFLEACTTFVLPSYYGEGTPKSALEAMATGRPLIVADAVGCREVVHDGRNGILVAPRDVQALVDGMLALAEDGALRRQMAAESRRMAEDVFDVKKVNAIICETMGI